MLGIIRHSFGTLRQVKLVEQLEEKQWEEGKEKNKKRWGQRNNSLAPLYTTTLKSCPASPITRRGTAKVLQSTYSAAV